MSEYFELGSSPAGEDCIQVDSNADYLDAMKEELKRYKSMLEKRFPIPEDIRAWFSIKWFTHDFGRYGEVAICYSEYEEESVDFACFVESNLPELWSDESVLIYVPEEQEQ